MIEFIGLRAKLYALRVLGVDNEKKCAKGIKGARVLVSLLKYCTEG